SVGSYGVSDEAREIMVRKDFFRSYFPQSFVEIYGPDGAPGRLGTDDDNNGTTDFLDPPTNSKPDPGELGYQGTDDLPVAKHVGGLMATPANHSITTQAGALLFVL